MNGIFENVILNKSVGDEMNQILLEGEILATDSSPDIAGILKPTCNLFINKIEPSNNRLNYQGKLNIQLLYFSKKQGEDEKFIHNLSHTANIDDFLNIEGVNSSSLAFLNAHIAHIDFRIINDRKIGYRAIVDIKANVEENKSLEIVKRIEGLDDNQQKRSLISINKVALASKGEFLVKEDIELSQSKSAIKEVIQGSFSLNNRDIRSGAERVNISGELNLSLLYLSQDDIIEFSSFDIPFSGAIDAAGAKETDFAEADLAILNNFISVLPNSSEENRILQIEATILSDFKIAREQEVEFLEDAYAIEQNIGFKTDSVAYNELICRNKNQFNVKELINIGDAPTILQVLNAGGRAIIEDIRVLEDKIIAEGLIDGELLYLAKSDETPVYSHKLLIPFKQTLETKGANANAKAEISHNLEHIGFNMLSESEVEIRFTLSFGANVVVEKKANFITEVEFSPFNQEEIDKLPSISLISIEKSDSLWAIAKKYNASIDELLSINDLETATDLTEGQKIIVLKKAV